MYVFNFLYLPTLDIQIDIGHS